MCFILQLRVKREAYEVVASSITIRSREGSEAVGLSKVMRSGGVVVLE